MRFYCVYADMLCCVSHAERTALHTAIQTHTTPTPGLRDQLRRGQRVQL
jgi:hypothetical protein